MFCIHCHNFRLLYLTYRSESYPAEDAIDFLSPQSMTRWSAVLLLSTGCRTFGSTCGGFAYFSVDKRAPRFRCRLYSSQHKNLWSIEECIKQRHTLKFIDGSWYHKGNRNARKEFEQGPRIPGAHFWDMDDIAASKELFPHLNPKGLRVMFPPKSLIAATLNAMNISSPTDTIMVYGQEGCWFTPRLWYTLKTFGQERVGLMQGSLHDWEAAGGPVDRAPLEYYSVWAKDLLPSLEQRDGHDKLERLVDMEQVWEQLKMQTGIADNNNNNSNDRIQFFDTRGSENFAKGHLPGATSIPYSSLVQADNRLKFKSREEMKEILQAAGIQFLSSANPEENGSPSAATPAAPAPASASSVSPPTSSIWLSCGSAVSVCHLALALEECGYPPLKPWIYDGSWNEWGSDPNAPKSKSSV